MNLRTSFLHNVIVHPLLFIADVLDSVGVGGRLARVLDSLHDVTAPEEGVDPGPLEPPLEAQQGGAWGGEDEEEDGDDFSAPVQSPHTAASRAMEFRPPVAVSAPPESAPLNGSAVARVQAMRRPG